MRPNRVSASVMIRSAVAGSEMSPFTVSTAPSSAGLIVSAFGRDRPALVAVPGDNAGADAMATFCSFSLIGLSFLPLAGRVVRSLRYLRGEALPEGHGATPAPSPCVGNLDTDLEARSSQPGDHAGQLIPGRREATPGPAAVTALRYSYVCDARRGFRPSWPSAEPPGSGSAWSPRLRSPRH
jgi:hypothetical protein